MDASSLNQLFIAFILLIPIVLIARTVVSGTKYSPILIIVVFGLIMGFLLERSGIAEAEISRRVTPSRGSPRSLLNTVQWRYRSP